MGNNSATMTHAKTNKADEFYTPYEVIEKELINYKNQFKDKIIYCNCDDYDTSNFVKYFQDKYHELGLKELIATSYNPEDNGTYYSYNGVLGYPSELEYNGDFRSLECHDIMLRSDIIVTNPPFSLFRDYIEMIMQKEKKFIILGNVNGATCKDIFHYFQEQKMWFGPSISSGDRKFFIPDDYPLEARCCGVDENGKRYIKVKGVRWFTNLKTDIDKPFLVLTEKYTPEKYPKYDNYDAINVNKTKDIPMDYDGVMGVPITFLDKHCINQFDILGIDRYIEDNPNYGKRFTINGKELYARILIKRKKIMKEKIVELMKESMLKKDSTRTSVLRAIKTAFTNFEKEGKTLTEADEVKILMKLKSQREDAINQFKSANREDLVDSEQKELDILIEYIPKQPSEDDIKEYTQSIIDRLKSSNGSITMKDMKSILSEVQQKYPTVNGKIVSECVKNNL